MPRELFRRPYWSTDWEGWAYKTQYFWKTLYISVAAPDPRQNEMDPRKASVHTCTWHFVWGMSGRWGSWCNWVFQQPTGLPLRNIVLWYLDPIFLKSVSQSLFPKRLGSYTSMLQSKHFYLTGRYICRIFHEWLESKRDRISSSGSPSYPV